jgi:Gas vesicle synthesis protein GvpL/GvpF
VRYLYAITEGGPVPEDVTGMRGVPLSVVSTAGLAAVTSEHEELRLAADEEDLWTHETVVEALMDRGTVLPMRFGTLVEGPDEVGSFLRDRAAQLTRALARVRGAVEIGVRVAVAPEVAEPAVAPEVAEPPPPAATDDAGPGAAYMLARLRGERRDAAIVGRVSESLAPLAREHVSMANPRRRASLSSAYLVERRGLDAFTERASALEEELGGVTVACTGPWPPYSFTSGEGD